MYDFLKPITVYYLRRMTIEDHDNIRHILENVENSVILCRCSYGTRYLYFLASLDGDLNYNLIHTKVIRPYYIEKIGEKMPVLQGTDHQWKNRFTYYAKSFVSEVSKYAITDLVYDFILKDSTDCLEKLFTPEP